MNDKILKVQELARYLKVDTRTIYRMVKDNRLPMFKIGNRLRFNKEAIDQWIERENPSFNKVSIPIVGKVAAGQPILAQEDIEGYVNVDKSIVRSADDVIALRVKGSSMIDIKINDGDVIVVRKQPVIEDGEIAVVLINDEVTLKRIYRENDKIKLVSENSAMAPMYFDPQKDNISVVGKFKLIVRKENS